MAAKKETERKRKRRAGRGVGVSSEVRVTAAKNWLVGEGKGEGFRDHDRDLRATINAPRATHHRQQATGNHNRDVGYGSQVNGG